MVARLDCVVDSIDHTIRSVASESNALLLRDVTISLATSAIRCEYLLVDRHGVLVIATEHRPCASIHGTSRSAEWVARSGRAQRRRFPNPLAANARRLEVVKAALLAFGRRFPSECFADLVVLEAADVRELSLRERQQLRIVLADDFDRVLRDRYASAIDDGPLGPREVLEIFSLLKRASGATDTPAEDARPATVTTAPAPESVPEPAPATAPAPESVPEPEPATAPAPVPASVLEPEPATAPAPVPASVLEPEPMPPLPEWASSTQAPAGGWLPASAPIMHAADPSFLPPLPPYAAAAAARRGEGPFLTLRLPSMRLVFLLIALSALVVWMSLYGGYDMIVAAGQDGLDTLSPSERPVFGSGVAGVDLDRAKSVFRERQPAIYESAEDINFPTVTPVEDEVTYVWRYKDASGTSREYSITFDLSGAFRRATKNPPQP